MARPRGLHRTGSAARLGELSHGPLLQCGRELQLKPAGSGGKERAQGATTGYAPRNPQGGPVNGNDLKTARRLLRSRRPDQELFEICLHGA